MRFGGKTKSTDDDLEMIDGVDEAEIDAEEEATQRPLTSSFLSGAGSAGAPGSPGVAPEADLDYSSLGEGSRLFSKSTLLVVLIMAIAAGSLYAMHLSQVDHTATDEQKRSEARIDQLMAQLSQGADNGTLTKQGIDAMFKDMDSVLGWLNNDRTESQVPVEFTRRNPFALLASKTETPKVGATKVDPEAVRIAALRAKLDTEIRTFKLQSVVPGGRSPVAIVNNKIVQVGAKLGSFTLVEIKDVGVVLEAEGQQFSLSLERDPNKPNDNGVRRVNDP
ncbi:MAG: hypothetical protein WD768_08500 [Phycisphaeraceae bacterium]